jgi:hypothetical protein
MESNEPFLKKKHPMLKFNDSKKYHLKVLSRTH